MVSQHLQKCGYYVAPKLSTSNTLVPNSKYLKNVSTTSAFTQTKKMLPSSASPIESQRSRKLHYIAHERTHSEVKDKP